MPGKGHRSDYAILTLMGVLTAACLLAILAWGSRADDDASRGVRTTHSFSVDGTMAARRLFERFDVQMSQFEDPLLSDGLAAIDVLWVIDPVFPPNKVEVAAIEDWVQEGGVLVTTGIRSELFEGLLDLERVVYDGCVSCRVQWHTPIAPLGSASEIPEPGQDLPLANGVSRIHLVTTETLEIDGEPEGQPAVAPLLRDERGVRIVMREAGQGAVILLADSSFLANGMIGRHDNAVLAMNLLSYSMGRAGGGRIAYDEYHQGYGSYESGAGALARMMLASSPGWAVIALTVAGVLFLLYKGRRFGTRRAPGRPRRRSKLDFVQAVGASFQTAGAHRLTWELIFAAWKRSASRELGLPASVPVSEIDRRLTWRAGKPPGTYRPFLEECEAATQQERLAARRFSNLLEELAKLEREALNGHGNRT